MPPIASASSTTAARTTVGDRSASAIDQLEPEEVVRAQGQQIRQVADAGEVDPPDELDRLPSGEARQVELDVLGESRQVGDAQDRHAVVLAQVGENAAVLRMEEVERAAPEDRVGAP